MAKNPKFDEARRKLDEALRDLDPDGDSAQGTPEQPQLGPSSQGRIAPRRRARPVHFGGARPSAGDDALPGPQTIRLDQDDEPLADAGPPPDTTGGETPGAPGRPPAPATEALTRLIVGAALLGLDGLAARSEAWETAAGIERRRQAPAADGEIGSSRFRQALIGWVFETEEQLRPRGNPISWLRAVVSYSFGTVFAVAFDLLPLPRFRRNRGALAEPSDEETRRWASRGRLEEERSRRFARAALEDMLDRLIVYLAGRPAVGRALGAIVRSPAMDDAVQHILAGPAVEQAIGRVAQSPALDEVVARVAQSPALDQAVSHIVRTPAMEDAVKYLAGTKGMGEAIDTISRSPALVDLVTTQSSSVAAEILEEVRERAVSGDKLIEGLARRLLRRPPRATLPPEARGLLLVEGESEPKLTDGGAHDR